MLHIRGTIEDDDDVRQYYDNGDNRDDCEGDEGSDYVGDDGDATSGSDDDGHCAANDDNVGLVADGSDSYVRMMQMMLETMSVYNCVCVRAQTVPQRNKTKLSAPIQRNQAPAIRRTL